MKTVKQLDEGQDKLIAKYTKLAARLSEFPLMNQADWKPEYDQEMETIRAELNTLRKELRMEPLDRQLRELFNEGMKTIGR